MRCVPSNTPAPVAYITVVAAISKGSVNLAAMTTVNENNAYKSAEELRRWFAETLSKPAVINYCGGGIAATADTLVWPMLGHNNVRLYDASLSEWARDPALPMQM